MTTIDVGLLVIVGALFCILWALCAVLLELKSVNRTLSSIERLIHTEVLRRAQADSPRSFAATNSVSPPGWMMLAPASTPTAPVLPTRRKARRKASPRAKK